MRHRIAGNRVNMPEARRRAAFRNMIDGLFTHEHIQTTEARAKAIQGEAEHLITIAIRGHNKAWQHLTAVVPDEDVANQVLALARRARFSLDEVILTNKERESLGKFPLSDDARKLKEARLSGFQKELLGLIKNRDDAQKALSAAREAMAFELHARRTIMRHLPQEVRVKKIFEIFVPRYENRPGGYTRISKIGFRQGDGAHIVRLEMV